MQQNNYVEAEDAYRRALSMAPDNNKMCNLGICLMKQGRILEAKETLRRVKPAVVDGPRGIDSHLKAFERARQMLHDLESEILNNAGDPIEQSRLFDAFLGSSSLWQPQPCKDQHITNANKSQDEFGDENINVDTNRVVMNHHHPVVLPGQKIVKPRAVLGNGGNSLNVAAIPFYSTKMTKEDPIGNPLQESLKRTRSGHAANSFGPSETGAFRKPLMEFKEPENKTRRRSLSPDETGDKWADLLPDSNEFEAALIAAVLSSATETEKRKTVETANNSGILPNKIDNNRLKVFQDITLSLSPRA